MGHFWAINKKKRKQEEKKEDKWKVSQAETEAVANNKQQA